MPTYQIKAPDGKTYRIQGPPGATDDQVRAEVLRQNPGAGEKPRGPVGDFVRGWAGPAPQRGEQESIPRALGRATWNLPMSGMEMLKGVMMSPIEIGKLAFTDEGHKRVAGMANDAAGILTGGLQHVRELSPEEYRGTAPAFDKTKFDNFVGTAKQNYGTPQRAASHIANDPAGAALAVASIVDPALRAAQVRGGLIGAADRGAVATAEAAARTLNGAKAATIDPAARLVTKVTTAERRAKGAAADMSAEATGTFKAAQGEAQASEAAATTRAARAQKLAEIARRRGRTLEEQRAAAVADAAPVTPEIGTPRHLSEMGDEIREPALAKQGDIETQMRAADAQYRKAMEDVAADRAAKGIGVSDTKEAKILIKRSRDLVKPNNVRRPEVGMVPAGSAGGKLHEMLLDVLEPKEIPLTVKEAQAAKRAGIKVNVNPDGSLSRTIKPDLKAVDDFRRYLGKVLDGSIEGYEAINRVEAQQMYGNVSRVIDKYVGGASKPVQANWAAGKQALEPFERVRAGQAVVGMQKGTSVPSVPAANIPGKVVAGGRDTVQQAAAVAGAEPVAATLRSQVQNAFTGAKSSAEAEALIRPGTTLGDAINADPALRTDVASYIARVKASEAAAARADDLARRSATATKRAKALDKTGEAAQADALKASQAARDYQRQIAALEIAEPTEVGSQYTKMIEQAHKEGRISTDQYQKGLKLAARAEKDFKLKKSRDRWIRYAGYLVGAGVAPGLIADVLSHKD